MSKLSSMLEDLRRREPAAKAALALLCCLLFLASAVLCGAVSVSLRNLKSIGSSVPAEKAGLLRFLKEGLLSGRCLLFSLALFLLAGTAFLTRYLRAYEPNPVSSQDERGVSFLEMGTYGTSRWMTEAEARDRFQTGDIRDIGSTVYGRFEDGGSEVVAYSERPGGGNRHLMLIGSTGSGKSVSFIRTEMIQALLRGESVVATDPSAELYTDLAVFARSAGADVKVLNLSSPLNGNGWNCVAECIDPDTGSLDSGRLNDFADIYMRNAGYPGSSDSFWYAAEINLFKAAIGLCSFRRNAALVQAYAEFLVPILRKGGYSGDQIEEIRKEFSPCMTVRDARALVRAYAEETGCGPEDLDGALEKAGAAAPPFSISEVYNTVLAMDDEETVRREFLTIPMTHPAAVAYKTYSSREINEKIKASSRMGLLNRMQIFNDLSLKGALSIDDLSLPDIGKRQTALFIITPDKTDTFKPISSLAFSFLFKDLSDEWDREQASSQKEGRKNGRLPVSVIMDEFYSVGSIPSFPVFIATCRKRLLNVTVALQNIGQLYDLYGENGGDTILSCCDTLLFLGCNDLTTAQFVSAFCAGESTVKSTSFRSPNGFMAALTQASDQRVGVSESARRLITPDEVRRFTDGVLVVARGEQPLRLKRFPFYDHPVCRAGMLRKSSVYEIPSVLKTHGYTDSFEGILLGQLIRSGTRARDGEDSYSVKLGRSLSGKAEEGRPPVPDPDAPLQVRKAAYTGFQEIYPAGSDVPLEIDWTDAEQFLLPAPVPPRLHARSPVRESQCRFN